MLTDIVNRAVLNLSDYHGDTFDAITIVVEHNYGRWTPTTTQAEVVMLLLLCLHNPNNQYRRENMRTPDIQQVLTKLPSEVRMGFRLRQSNKTTVSIGYRTGNEQS